MMTANIAFFSSYGSTGKADYYMRPTQEEWERNNDFDYKLKQSPDLPGTIPELHPETSELLINKFGLRPDANMRLDYEQVGNLITGLRADGLATGKKLLTDYVRKDGQKFKARDYFDITSKTHISIGLALANAETPAGRALILSAAERANHAAMQEFRNKLGFLRSGANGTGPRERAEILILTFPHHATRPASDGFVAPCLHFHNVGFNLAVSIESNRVGGIDGTKIPGSILQFFKTFHGTLADEAKSLGIATHKHETGATVFSDVPEKLADHFSKRNQEIVALSQKRAAEHGFNWDELTPKEKQKWNDYSSRITGQQWQESIADTRMWRAEARRLGWPATDLAKPSRPIPTPTPSPSLTRAQTLRLAVVQTWQAARQIGQQAKLRGIAAPSLKLRRQIALLSQSALSAAQKLKQKFDNLAKSFNQKKEIITQRAYGRRLVHSLTPQFMELKAMSYSSSVQPLQKDHESLGQYLAGKHRLASSFAPQIAAAGELVNNGQISLTEATLSLMHDPVTGNYREHLQERLTSAIADSATFYDHVKPSNSFAVVGQYRADGPFVFADSYGDAAMARDATGGKVTILTGYNKENTDKAMQEAREAEPKREFIRIVNGDPDKTFNMKGVANITVPKNGANAETWQDYAKNYGISAVASNMRQSFRQEFRQAQTGQKISVTA